jgi:hypothetical protein
MNKFEPQLYEIFRNLTILNSNKTKIYFFLYSDNLW